MKKWIILGMLTMFFISAKAQNTNSIDKDSYKYNPGWYVGVHLGMPMGSGEFVSWGADKFHAGWNLGVNGGYRFSEILAFGLSANYGEMTLSEKKVPGSLSPQLGSDGKFYFDMPDNVNILNYSDLKSTVFLQRYGLHAKINILGLIKATQGGKWMCEIVPSIYLAETMTDIVTKADKKTVINDIHKWHFGCGINAQAMYALTDNLDLGLYVGITAYTGKSIDGLPTMHAASYTPEFGLKASWNFNAKTIKQKHNHNQGQDIEQKTISADGYDVDTISMKYKEAYDAQVNILLGKTIISWDNSLKGADLSHMKSACDSNMSILQENVVLFEDSDELQKRYEEWETQKRFIECYEGCVEAVSVAYNEETVNYFIEVGTAFRDAIPRGAFRSDMTSVLIKLDNYKEVSLHMAAIINGINNDVLGHRDLGNHNTRVLTAIRTAAKDYIDSYDLYAIQKISEYPYLKELYAKYLNDLEENPMCNSSVEKLVADMLGLDYMMLQRGECTIEFNVEE